MTETEKAAAEGQKSAESKATGYSLQEEHIIQNSLLLRCMNKLSGAYNPWTNMVMDYLRHLAAREEFVSITDCAPSFYEKDKHKLDDVDIMFRFGFIVIYESHTRFSSFTRVIAAAS